VGGDGDRDSAPVAGDDVIKHAVHRSLEPNPALARHSPERAPSVQHRLAARFGLVAAQIEPAAAGWQRASAISNAQPRKET